MLMLGTKYVDQHEKKQQQQKQTKSTIKTGLSEKRSWQPDLGENVLLRCRNVKDRKLRNKVLCFRKINRLLIRKSQKNSL